MLKPGTYKLTRDVKNPKPDRRKTSDWTARSLWRAGGEFIVEDDYNMRHRMNEIDELEDVSDEIKAKMKAEFQPATRIMLVGHRWKHQNVGPFSNAEQYAALEAALEPTIESFDAMFTRLDVPSEYFARWLVESGRLTPSAFEKLWETYQDNGQTRASEPVVQGPQLTSTEISGTLVPCVGSVTPATTEAPKDRFRWLIEIEVDKTWIEDGFDIDNDRALNMLANDLRYATIGVELDARVVARPADELIAVTQGYTVDEWRQKNERALKSFGQWVNRRSKS